MSIKTVFIFEIANSAFHLDLQCLSKYLLTSIQNEQSQHYAKGPLL